MRVTLWWLLRRNMGFPVAAALFLLSAAGLGADLVLCIQGRPHPLTVIFAASTVICTLVLVIAQPRLAASFRFGRAGPPR
jgi:hypothetical protein